MFGTVFSICMSILLITGTVLGCYVAIGLMKEIKEEFGLGEKNE